MTIIIVYITKERGFDMYYRNDEYILSVFYCNDGETEKIYVWLLISVLSRNTLLKCKAIEARKM
jgi:hypothetical protein